MSTPTPYPRPPLPRLQFRGRFFADPSTVNNNVNRYNVDTFRPNYNYLATKVGGKFIMNGSWNPEGSGVFTFEDCKIINVKTVHAATTAPSFIPGRPAENIEPLLNTKVRNTQYTVQAKMSDMDPQMQYLSEIFGLHINVGDEIAGFSGIVRPCSVRDMWMNMTDYEDAVLNAGAIYQSVIVLSSPLLPGSSPTLMEFAPFVEQSKCEKYPHGALSITFRLSTYQGNYGEEDFRYGQNVGFIEPWLPGTPEMFPATRNMVTQSPMTKDADFCIQKSEDQYSLRVNLLNSLQRNKDNTYKDLGTLFLAVLPNDPSSHVAFGSIEYETLAEIPYATPGWEEKTSGIFELSIPAEKVPSIESQPLGVVSVDFMGNTSCILSERPDGLYCHADICVFRLNSGETKLVDFYMTKFGKREPFHSICIGYDPSTMDNNGEGPGNPKPGVPSSSLAVNGKAGDDGPGENFKFMTKTNSNGFVQVQITGYDPKTPREFIDGQVYALRYAPGTALPKINPAGSPSNNINVIVYDKNEIPRRPSWITDVYPKFKQYANLYPAMRTIVNLDDYGSVVSRREALIRVFEAPMEDPMYMPASRDLSENKRKMFLKWLKAINMDPSSEEYGMPLYMDVTRKEDLKNALQTVVELEHGTLPPYLTALMSIKRGYNQYVADAIRDIAMEEMLHMGLVCNIMNSIGFRPNISKVGFIPRYPGPLPGGLRSGLIVRLRKCCKEQLAAFMEIEAPLKQKLPDQNDVTAIGANGNVSDLQTNQYTIAFLYEKVAESLKYHSERGKIRFDDPENERYQVTGPWPGKLIAVRSLQDALHAIDIIKEQGEGASPSDPSEGSIDPDTGLPMLAHYFRFAEIVKGRRIVYMKDGSGFSYTGPKIEIDEDGIYNMQDDPNAVNLPPGSKARERLDSFSKKYKALLVGLHRVFNGEPSFLDQTLSSMYQLTLFAKPLMEMPALDKDGNPKKDGTTVGVSFQYPFEEAAVIDPSNLV